ncbi:hypothetical protein DXG03_004692 [Asterophora parasitica]|uniref:Uncharacterized protein n=1 Tax=Asterophora parasitica TaxID=117018 RepID=A0A9P7K9Y7_9AGAR|nr:hypothetical protein DXG03_004692 [Asterophora parasitica]
MANHASRAAMRKQRLLEMENEMRLEEAEALKMTEEQRQILFRSFTSVKVEFSDLDGLARNANGSQHIPRACVPPPNPTVQLHPPDHAFVILTNADLANFAPHETIRASVGSRPKPRSSTSSPDLSARARLFPGSSPPLKQSSLAFTPSSYLSSSAATIKAILSRKTPRSRSPIRGIFPTPSGDAYESDSEHTVRGSDSDNEVSPRPKKERRKSRNGRGHAASGAGHIVSPNLGSRPRLGSGPGLVRHVSKPATSQSRRDASKAAALRVTAAAGSHRDAVCTSLLH